MTLPRLLIVSLILGITIAFQSIYALTFPATPAGESDGGALSQYFRNAVGNPCPTNSFVTGFSTGSVGVYMTPLCTGILSGITIPATGITGGTEGYITRFSTGGNGIISSRIFETGTYIGIGTANPRSTLELSGQIMITGGSPGTGRILTSDANGLASWEVSTAAMSATLWSILGNTGTTAGTNFIGTNDGVDIVFKTNALEKMRIRDSDGDLRLGTMTIGKGGGSILSNSALGISALGSNTSGTDNTAIGLGALFSNGIGNRNTGVGEWALNPNISGNDNVSLGYNAGSNLASGDRNIAIGSSISFPSSTGSNQLNIGNWIYGSGGNIGIGVTVPTSKLSISGSVSITGGYLNYAPGGINCTSGQNLIWNTGSTRWECGSGAASSVTISGTGMANLVAKWSSTGSNVTLTGASGIYESGGSLGINVASPLAKLHIDSGTVGVSGIRFSKISSATSPTPLSRPIGVTASGDIVISAAGNVAVYTSKSSQTTQDSTNYLLPLSYNQYFVSGQQETFTTTDVSGLPAYAPNLAAGTDANSVCNGTGTGVSASCVATPWANFTTSAYNIGSSGNSYSYQLAMSDRTDTPLFFRGGRIKGWAGTTASCTSSATCNLTGGVWNSDGSRVANWFAVLSLPANHTEFFYINPGVDVNNNPQSGGGKIGVGTVTPMTRMHIYTSGGSTEEILRVQRGSGSDASMINSFGTPYVMIGGSEYRSNSIQTIGFGFNSSTGSFQPAEIGFNTTSTTGNTRGDIVFANRNGTSNTAPTEVLRITASGAVGIGNSGPNSLLDVDGSFKLGTNGTSLNEILKSTASITIPTIAANTTTQVNVTVSNANTVGSVMISPSGLLPSGIVIAYARVSSAGTVTIAYRNTTAASIVGTTLNHYITIIQ